MSNFDDCAAYNIPEITQDDGEKDEDLQRVMVESWLKMLENKLQDLIIMFSSSKHYNIQGIVKQMNISAQRNWNKDLEEVIVSLYHIGKHITKDIKADLSTMGVSDSSFLVKKASKSQNEFLTFRENEFLIK